MKQLHSALSVNKSENFIWNLTKLTGVVYSTVYIISQMVSFIKQNINVPYSTEGKHRSRQDVENRFLWYPLTYERILCISRLIINRQLFHIIYAYDAHNDLSREVSGVLNKHILTFYGSFYRIFHSVVASMCSENIFFSNNFFFLLLLTMYKCTTYMYRLLLPWLLRYYLWCVKQFVCLGFYGLMFYFQIIVKR